MRRLFAYITLAITLIVGIVLGVPSIKDASNPGTEFDGGHTILYHLTDTEHQDFLIKNEKEIKLDQAIDNINGRLKTLSISNPQVDIENETYIRVTLPDMSTQDLNNAKYIIANTGEVTVRDENDQILGYGADLFEELYLQGNQGLVYLMVKIKDYDAFGEITHELSHSYTGTAEQPVANMFIWVGFEEKYCENLKDELGFDGDSYGNAGENEYCLSKLLCAMAVDQEITEDFGIQSPVPQTCMTAYNKILKDGKFNYCLDHEYTADVGSYYSEKAMNLTILSVAIALVIICALLIVAYRKAAIASALSLVATTVLTFASYNLFGGLFGAETILALLVGIGLAVDANVVILERCKEEIRKGKNIARAYDEGSKKSVSTILDSNIITLIAAFALYLFGSQVIKSFSAVLIISQVSIMLVVILLTRFMLSIICHSKLVEGKPGFFGVKEDEIDNRETGEKAERKNRFEKVDFVKKTKIKQIVSAAIIGLGLVMGVLFGIGGKTFNTNSDLKNGTRIFYRTFNPEMSEVAKVEEFFAQETYAGKKASKITIENTTIAITAEELTDIAVELEGFGIDIDTVNKNRVDVYNVTVYFDKTLSNDSIDEITTYFEAEAAKFYDKDNEIDILDTCFSIGNFKQTSGTKAVLNSLLAVGMLLVFAIIYLSIRFSFSYALSAAITVLHNVLIYTAVLIITRLQVGTWAIAGGLAVSVLTLGNCSITFDKLRENVREAKGVIWTIDTRKEYINKSLQQTLYGHLFSNISTVAVAILAFVMGGVSLMPIGVGCVLVVLAASYGAYYVLPLVWAKLDTVFANAKAERKARRAARHQDKVDPDANEPEEYVFFGIND